MKLFVCQACQTDIVYYIHAKQALIYIKYKYFT